MYIPKILLVLIYCGSKPILIRNQIIKIYMFKAGQDVDPIMTFMQNSVTVEGFNI